MPQYSYTVINKENKQLTGTINAPDETAARKELNAMEFSILTITDITNVVSQAAEETPTNIVKFEFMAVDKNGKNVIGTIQGEDIYPVYKRLTYEYAFDVKQLYPTNLPARERESVMQRGVDELKDRLHEEQMEAELLQKKQEMDETAFLQRQEKLKAQVEFVLQKVNSILDTYKDELDPVRKTKIKYFVEKILRIRNSTNLEYIKETCEEMLTYLQKEEIFLHQEQRLNEKTKLTIEAKSMMMQLNRISKSPGKDIFESLRKWRKERITENSDPTFIDRTIDMLIVPLIGLVPEDDEIIMAKEKISNLNGQLMQYVTIYFQSPTAEFKKEIMTTLLSIWNQRKTAKKELAEIIHRKHQAVISNVEFTVSETLEKEIFGVAGWILCFYIIYYFATIYLNSKQIDFIPPTKLSLIFQTSIIKYFFTTLFFFVCILGIKIEFFKRKPLFTPLLFLCFLFFSSLIIINF